MEESPPHKGLQPTAALDLVCITYGNEVRPSNATRDTQTVRSPAAAVTVAPGPSPPSSDSADQHSLATAGSPEP